MHMEALSLPPSSPCMPAVTLSPGSVVGVEGSIESTLAASEIRVNLEDNILQKIHVCTQIFTQATKINLGI